MKRRLQDKIFGRVADKLLFRKQHQINIARLRHRLSPPFQHGIRVADKVADTLVYLGKGDAEGVGHGFFSIVHSLNGQGDCQFAVARVDERRIRKRPAGNKRMKLITGNSNLPLAKGIADYMGLPLTDASVRRFADNEIFVEVHENVRGEDMFVIQSTSHPANDNLMELLIIIDALRRSSAKRITAVLPYFGYARQDRKPGPRTPISAKLVANLITEAGADRVLTVDLHAGQIQGFFDIPTDNLYGAPVMAADILERHNEKSLTVVSPDVGGVVRARALAKRINDAPLAIVDKRREKAGVSEVMNIIGDVKDRFCILIDDIADSAGTLCNAADALKAAGASDVVAYITHGVLSGEAVNRVNASSLRKLVITDSIIASDAARNSDKIRQLPLAPLLGEAIKRIADESSVSSLFD